MMDSCQAIQGDKDETKITYEKKEKKKVSYHFHGLIVLKEGWLCDASVAGIYAED